MASAGNDVLWIYDKVMRSEEDDIELDDVLMLCDALVNAPINLMKAWVKGYSAFFHRPDVCKRLCEKLVPVIDLYLPPPDLQDAFADMYNYVEKDDAIRNDAMLRFKTELKAIEPCKDLVRFFESLGVSVCH